MSQDAIVMLKEDHKKVRALFRDFQRAGDDATATKAKIVDKILEELTVHTYIENEGMYPDVRALLPELEDDILESLEEHHVADVLCMELSMMSPDHDHFDAKVSVLIENVEHHIEEEESDWFPKVREKLGRNELVDIGARLEKLRAKAPRRPSQPGAIKKAVRALVS
ncbi:MAG TPA: hemerythrin domain-containing protein [Mycobacteriales bacterium]|jgi:hemerythrin superfamily protein|nr:hemerythrin domain-containing protein [Mycobacteriales bacterium]